VEISTVCSCAQFLKALLLITPFTNPAIAIMEVAVLQIVVDVQSEQLGDARILDL
jgi:hypothetical protein